MVFPDPEAAPEILPVIVPVVQLKVELTEAVNNRLAPVPLHVAAVALLTTAGAGFTVAVMVNGFPAHPTVEVGVTRY